MDQVQRIKDSGGIVYTDQKGVGACEPSGVDRRPRTLVDPGLRHYRDFPINSISTPSR